MKPKHQNKRFALFGLGAFVVGLGMFLLLQALGDAKQLFKDPSKVVAADFVQGKNQIKIGGLVVEGSVSKNGMITRFSIVDFDSDGQAKPLKIIYDDALPDLFAEGQGVVLTGKMGDDGVFVADMVLAKHDENYRPKM